MGDKLIWSKRYGEDEEYRYIDKLCEAYSKVSDTVNSLKKESNEQRIRRKEANEKISNFFESITRVPDEERIAGSERFIAEAKRFSQSHRVSADIYRGASMVSVWLFFGTDILTGDRKNDFVALIENADEISGIPHPNGMSDWCEFAVILCYMTHHSYVEGRELHPFQ